MSLRSATSGARGARWAKQMIAGPSSYTRRESTLVNPSGSLQSPNFHYKYLDNPPTAAPTPPGGFDSQWHKKQADHCSGGQGRAGVELGPNRLIDAGLPSQLTSLGWRISYDPLDASTSSSAFVLPNVGSDSDIGRMKKPRLVSEVCKRVSGHVGDVARKGWLPVTLGGDHSLGMATVSGVKSAHPEAGLIWVDAHADINTPETTDSGNLHGCPVSFLLGLTGTNVAPFNEWLQPCLKPSDIVYIGLRDIDGEEKRILREHRIKCYTMHEVDKYGIGKVMEMALDHMNGGRERELHLSFDVDAMDPSVAPSTGTPVRGGLSFREGHYITEAVAQTGCLVALDVMEVNPTLADSRSAAQTVAIGCSLARAALGETLL